MNDLVLYPCDLCGSDDLAEIACAPHYTAGRPVHVCRGCGFVQVALRHPPEALQKMWAEEMYRVREEGLSDKTYTARMPAITARQTFAAEFLAAEIDLAGKTLCDIGAGEGQFIDMMQDRRFGMTGFGIEPSAENCALLDAQKIESFCGTMEDFAAAETGRTFDVASLTWTLENCQSASAVLRETHRAVAADGHILIATGSRILMPFKKPLQYYLGSNVDVHPYHFSANALTSLMHKAGFQVIAHNRFIDSDYLVLVGKRVPSGTDLAMPTDDPDAVLDYFDRWHADTQAHYADW